MSRNRVWTYTLPCNCDLLPVGRCGADDGFGLFIDVIEQVIPRFHQLDGSASYRYYHAYDLWANRAEARRLADRIDAALGVVGDLTEDRS